MTKNNKPSRIVLITAPAEEDWLQRLRSLWPDLQFVQLPARSKTVSDELWREAEILYMSFATSLPTTEQAPRLRWVQLYSAGADAVFQSSLFQTSAVNFTTTSGIHAIPMAEYTFTMVLAWFHRLPNLLDLQRQEQWPHNNVRSTSLVPIEGAALDVFQHEPLPSNSPLWHLPNVFITPHISGLTTQYNERAAALFAENLRRYLTGQPLFNVVDKAKGY